MRSGITRRLSSSRLEYPSLLSISWISRSRGPMCRPTNGAGEVEAFIEGWIQIEGTSYPSSETRTNFFQVRVDRLSVACPSVQLT